jgi:hypothetical protein
VRPESSNDEVQHRIGRGGSRRDRDEISNEFGNLNPARDAELNEVVESVPDKMEVR